MTKRWQAYSRETGIALITLILLTGTSLAEEPRPRGVLSTWETEQGPTPEPQQPTEERKPGFPGPIYVGASVDFYSVFNANRPWSGQNQLRNFDTKANGVRFSLLEFVAERSVEARKQPLGFRVDVNSGPTTRLVHSLEPGRPGRLQYLQQAYVSYAAPLGSGLTVDFGKFVTPAGLEVIETKDNWNYSRSLLFAWAIPYYHAGARAKYVVSSSLAVTGFLVNGWNNVRDNNGSKTVAGQVTFNPTSKSSITQTLVVGNERNEGEGSREVSDTIVTYAFSPRVSAAANFSYGQDRSSESNSRWHGLAAYTRVNLSERWTVSPRVEYFNDPDGFSTGTSQLLHEATVTVEHRFLDNVLLRFEARRDRSNTDFFETHDPAVMNRHQTTVLGGILFRFEHKR